MIEQFEKDAEILKGLINNGNADKYRIILEEVLDTLTEVGNGASDEALHESFYKLLAFRDDFFDKTVWK